MYLDLILLSLFALSSCEIEYFCFSTLPKIVRGISINFFSNVLNCKLHFICVSFVHKFFWIQFISYNNFIWTAVIFYYFFIAIESLLAIFLGFVVLIYILPYFATLFVLYHWLTLLFLSLYSPTVIQRSFSIIVVLSNTYF